MEFCSGRHSRAGVLGVPHPARIRARRGVHARALLEGQGAGPDHRHPRHPADGAGGPAYHRHGRTQPGRHLPRQRLGQGQRRRLLPRARSGEGHHPGRALRRRHQPARADHAALGARAARARRDAGRARKAQLRHPEDPRPPDRRLGHQGLHRGDQAHRPQRGHDPGHRQAGRGRAHAARQGHRRGGRAAGLGDAHSGGQGALGRPARDHAALPAEHARHVARGPRQHDRLPSARRAVRRGRLPAPVATIEPGRSPAGGPGRRPGSR